MSLLFSFLVAVGFRFGWWLGDLCRQQGKNEK